MEQTLKVTATALLVELIPVEVALITTLTVMEVIIMRMIMAPLTIAVPVVKELILLLPALLLVLAPVAPLEEESKFKVEGHIINVHVLSILFCLRSRRCQLLYRYLYDSSNKFNLLLSIHI